MSTVNEVFDLMSYLKYKGYGHYNVLQGYDCNCCFEDVNVKHVKLDTRDHTVLLPCGHYDIDKKYYEYDLEYKPKELI